MKGFPGLGCSGPCRRNTEGESGSRGARGLQSCWDRAPSPQPHPDTFQGGLLLHASDQINCCLMSHSKDHAHGLPTPALPEPMLLCWAPHTLTASTSLRKPDLSEAEPEAPTSLATLWAQGSLDWMAGPASPSLGRTAPPLLSLDGAGPRDHGSRLHREQGLDPRSALALPSAHGDTPCCCCCC